MRAAEVSTTDGRIKTKKTLKNCKNNTFITIADENTTADENKIESITSSEILKQLKNTKGQLILPKKNDSSSKNENVPNMS